MEKFEQYALDTSSLKPDVWLRHVGRRFCCHEPRQGKLRHFHFTMKIEKDGTLSFLDVPVCKKRRWNSRSYPLPYAISYEQATRGVKHIKQALINNGYSRAEIKCARKRRLNYGTDIEHAPLASTYFCRPFHGCPLDRKTVGKTQRQKSLPPPRENYRKKCDQLRTVETPCGQQANIASCIAAAVST
ncbi:hypothetical protein Trydic_g11735 [Trypoxylus dichotomus]